jgi:hypothetical protein
MALQQPATDLAAFHDAEGGAGVHNRARFQHQSDHEQRASEQRARVKHAADHQQPHFAARPA